jgi:uncharacterized protein
MKPRFLTLVSLFGGLLLVSSLLAVVPPVPEQPANYVVDLAGIIDPQIEADLNRRLKELENRTTAQMVVLTIHSLEGEPIEKFSLRTAEKWALGQKGKDNGVLITIAVQDRKYRIEVGYGLEAILPDSLVGSIGRECFVANFRRGNYSVGIYEAVRKITGQIIGNEVGKTTIEPKVQEITEILKKTVFSFLQLIIPFIIFIFIAIINKQRRKRPDIGWGPGFVGGSGSGGGGGGGFGGGFGGGGVSGGW